MGFVHLHVHSEYSLLDGFCKIKELPQYVKDLGQSAVAITDHGVMYGAIDFYKACKAAGIKPIIGCEVYMAQRSRFDKSHDLDGSPRHLVLLCKNESGYRNLSNMVSKAYEEGFYYKPRIDMELLSAHHEGLIALSACLGGEIPQRILQRDLDGARNFALQMRDLFGPDFYLELQDHGMQEQAVVNEQLLRLHQETGIPLVCTNDCHYIREQDAEAHDVLLCIQTGKTLDDPDRMKYEPRKFYVRSTEEMEALFSRYPGAVENTELIAAQCNLEFTFGKYHLPEFKVPDGFTAQTYIRRLCEMGFQQRYGDHPEYRKQLEYELNMIEKMGFTDYFLIVSDFVQYAKTRGIPVGPGRGSAAGSMVSYCLYITDIDPIKYSLYFERFLNPERVTMPDIDMDFGDARRQEVIDYVSRKYGKDHVAQIVTFGTMAAKGAIRDVGRVLGMPYAEVAAIAKLIPNTPKITIKDALEQNPDLKQKYDQFPNVGHLLNMAMKIEGTPRNASTHAAGVVITKDPVSSYVPLALNDSNIVCQYTMVTLEELGLLKMDFLALRNLTILDNAAKMIQQKEPNFKMDMIRDDDQEVFKMLADGNTAGVFQMESSGMTGVCTSLRPQSIEDLTAIVALYRPGPMDSIPRFVANKHDPAKITYKHPSLEPILSITYGCIVYQEQVIEIFRRLGGYSLGQADMVRRAMSKKKVKDIEREREAFLHGDAKRGIPGCVANGIPETVGMEIYDEIYAFANYAFNKAHAVSYAVVAYQTAWFKYHYPHEYMAALLTSVLDSQDKVAEYINAAKNMGIELLPPHVNASGTDFAVEGNGIRFGLVAIKNVGAQVIQDMVNNRMGNGPFKSFPDFCERCYEFLNARALESMICAGALDGLGPSRRQMVSVSAMILDSISQDRKMNLDGQIGFDTLLQGQHGTKIQESSEITYPELPEFSKIEMLQKEKEVTGLYISGHPMDEFRDASKRAGAVPISIIKEAFNPATKNDCFYDGQIVMVSGILGEPKIKLTKTGNYMAYIWIEDMLGTIELICFSKTLDKYRSLLTEGRAVLVRGKISAQDDRPAQIICNDFYLLEKSKERKKEKKNVPEDSRVIPGNCLWVRVPCITDELLVYLGNLLAMFPGDSLLRLVCKQTGVRLKATCSYAEPLVQELRKQQFEVIIT